MKMMVNELSLHNFKIFQDRNVRFSPGINILQGPNGSGKTSILESIEFALFGSVTGTTGLAPLVSIGENQCTVSLSFRPRGVSTEGSYRILRQLSKGDEGASTTQTRLTRNGDEMSSKKTAVEATLDDLLPVDQGTYRNSCYIRQGEIRSLLEAGKEREREIDRMIGLGVFEEAWKDLRKRQSRLEDEVSGAREELIRAQAEVENAESISEELSRRMEEKMTLQAEIKKMKSEPGISEDISAQDLEGGRDQASTRQRLENIEHNRGALDERIDSANERLNEIEADILRRENRIESLREEKQSLQERKKRIAEDLQEHQQSLQQLENDVLKLQADLELQERLVKTFSQMEAEGESICPLCGSQLTVQHARDARGSLDQKIQDLQSSIRSKEKDRERFKQAVDRFQSRLSRLDQELREAEREISEARSQNSGLRTSKEEIETQLSSDLQSKREMEKEIKKEKEMLQEMEKSAPSVGQESNRLAKYMADKRMLERLEKEISQLMDKLGQEQMKKTRLKSIEERHSSLEDELERVKDIRWAFNNIGPHARKRILPTVESRTDQIFRDIYSGDFIEGLELDDDYGVIARTASGKMPLEMLSVGERVMAGLSMRIALSRVFRETEPEVQDQGFLILDEPTEYMDQENVRSLASTLAGLEELGQVILVTHDRDLVQGMESQTEVNTITLP